MDTLRFDRAFLRLFAAPIIWAMHFLTVYGAVGIICARGLHRSTLLGMDISSWVVAGTSAASVLAVLLLSLRNENREPPRDNASFTRWTSAALGMLSIIAIIWEGMAILLVPACE